MKYHLGASIFAGLIIGGLLGAFFFVVPAKMLIGDMPTDGFWLSAASQDYLLGQTLFWGVMPGLIIGFLGGCNTNATWPRGHFSKSIGVWCCIICLPGAWISQWKFIENMSGGRIFFTVFMTLVMLFSNYVISGSVSLLEAIREKGGSHD